MPAKLGDIVPPQYQKKLGDAVAHYWKTLLRQAKRQGGGTDLDRGARASVTGGKQMQGFCELVKWLACMNGLPDACVYIQSSLELPGYFRPTKKWDMVVVHKSHLVAAIEFKSQAGPSFGNNFNNRTEEALGNATDLWTAYREGAFGLKVPRPWLGWVMLLEDCLGSTRPVGNSEPHFRTFPEFTDASYARRYELLLQKLLLEKLYDGVGLIMATRQAGKNGKFREPAEELSMRRFLAGLGAHIRLHVETTR